MNENDNLSGQGTPSVQNPPSEDDDSGLTNLGIAGNLTRAFIKSPLTPLFLLAAFAFGLVALLTLPREEEPQISVPMVDVMVEAPGLKADDAVKLVTEPLETIVKSIDGVEHVYSQSMDNRVMVTARFVVGTSSDAAILRVHDKVRANSDRIPVGIPEPMIVGRGIDDVAIVSLTLSPSPAAADRVNSNDLTRIARELRTEIARIDDVGLTYLVGETGEVIRISPQPRKARSLWNHPAAAGGKGQGANSAVPAGQVRSRGGQIDIMAGETLSSPDAIDNLLLTSRDGRPVYVRDVANVAFVTNTSDALVATVRRDGPATERVPSVTLAIAQTRRIECGTVADTILQPG